MAERETALYKAKLAEQTRRYHDMFEEMKSVALMDVELTEEEKYFLLVGYVNTIKYRQASCSTLSSIKRKEESKGHQVNVERVEKYIEKVQAEITKICDDFCNSILHHHVIPSCSSPENRAVYYSM